MRKTFHKLHLWLSIPFGLIISIICFSGAVLVFEKEIMELVRHDLYYVTKVEAKTIPLEQLMATVTKTLPDSVTITGVSIASSPDKAYQVTLSKPRRASIYIDQYTAEIKGRNERTALFTFMFRTHRWLLDSANPNSGIFWGKMIVGISTLMFVFVLISGIVVWVPRTRKALKNRLKITADKGIRRLFYDLHVAAGAYAATILLLLALTGLTWSFSWYRTGFYTLFGVETITSTQGGHAAAGKQSTHGEGSNGKSAKSAGTRGETAGGDEQSSEEQNLHSKYTVWSKVHKKLTLINPDFKTISISDTKASVATKHFGNQRATDSYEFDHRNGEIIKVVEYQNSARSSKLRGWIYSLHVGDWGGLFSKTITLLAALIGASLPLTGYYIWIKRCYRKTR